MLKYLLVLILLISNSFVFAQKYVLVWNDEFNTPGLPDSTKWSHEIGKIRNNELQYYTKARIENTRIEDTVLIIEARKENFAGAAYTSGSIISKGVGDWKYGKVEISAKVPTGKGTWPALWMMPTYSEYGGWPRSGEIDIMEYIGVEPQNLYYTVHFQGVGESGHSSKGSGPKSYFKNPWEQFIKYTLIWTPQRIDWYANDIRFHSYLKSGNDYRTWPFDKEFYLILNLAYGGSWGGYAGVDDSKLPHRFLIDYVRVYQLQDSEGPFSVNIDPAEGGTIEISPQMDSYPEGTEVTLTAFPDENYVFKNWKHMSGANPYTFNVNKNTTIFPVFQNENELLTNRNFDISWQPWTFYVYNSETTSYNPIVNDGKFEVNITKSPGTDWHLGFQELGISMQKGKYSLTFDAVAEQSKSLLITVSKNYPDWGAIVTKRATITKTLKSYEIPIDMPINDENTRLYFGIGSFSGKFTIDNISLKRVDNPATSLQMVLNAEPEISIYPNPSDGFFYVNIPQNENSTIFKLKIFNLQGIEILNKTVSSGLNQIHTRKLLTGNYILQIESNNTNHRTKIVIQ